LVFISIILAFSIFLISYYTYYQMLNNRLAIVGFTFLIAGVFDTFHLLSYPDMPELSGMGASSGESIVYWLLAKIVNAAGLFVLVSTPEQRKDRIGRVWKLVLSMLFILTSVIFISIYPGMADLIYGSGGIK